MKLQDGSSAIFDISTYAQVAAQKIMKYGTTYGKTASGKLTKASTNASYLVDIGYQGI